MYVTQNHFTGLVETHRTEPTDHETQNVLQLDELENAEVQVEVAGQVLSLSAALYSYPQAFAMSEAGELSCEGKPVAVIASGDTERRLAAAKTLPELREIMAGFARRTQAVRIPAPAPGQLRAASGVLPGE